MFDKLFGKRPTAVVIDDPAVDIVPKAAVAQVQISGNFPIAPRKWVVWDNYVGICHRLFKEADPSDARNPAVVKAEVHLTNQNGETTQVVVVDPASLRLARWAEIPAPRRPESAVRAAMRGYF